MKNYYETLGLTFQASEEEIKRAYRRLALVFHPDKNSSVEAEFIIKEINEAYEVLGDSEKRRHYDLQLANPSASERTGTRHRDPAYRKKPPGYKPPPSQAEIRLRMMRKGLGFMKFVSVVGSLCCVMLCADYFLPPVILREKVIIDMDMIKKVMPNNKVDLLVTEKGHHFPVVIAELHHFPEGARIKIYTSPIFSLLVCVESANSDYQLNNLATIYRNFGFGPIVLLLFSIASLVGSKGVEFRYTIGIAILMMMFLNAIFISISHI